MLQDIQNLLSSLPGVIDSAYVRPDDVGRIHKAEDTNQKVHLVPLKNLGIQVLLERQHVFAILKDTTFRPPPGPTIYMVEEELSSDADGASDELLSSEMYLRTDGRVFRIIGEEVLDKKKEYFENHMFFENDFVLFPDRRKNRQNIPALLVLPPIPFPELESEKEKYSIENIMSISPGTQCDDFIREAYNFSKNPEYATILIGLDSGGTDRND